MLVPIPTPMLVPMPIRSIRSLCRRPSSAILFAAAAMALLPAAVLAAGAAWRDLPVAQALAAAEKEQKLLLIDFHASHCGACGQLDIDVWDTPDGAALTDGLIAIRADTATPDGGSASIRYAVTGLPAVLVLRPDGTEVDRVIGYQIRRKFIDEVGALKDGIDPLPMLEDRLKAHPDSLPACMPVYERYLNRGREADAKKLLDRILVLDPVGRGQSDRALMLIAKYEGTIAMDQKQAFSYWRMLVDRFPGSSMVMGAIDGAYKAAAALGQVPQWKDWILGLVEKYPSNGRIQYAAAMTAHRAGLIDRRFADAARSALRLGVGGAFLDTIAARLEGSPAVPGQKR